MTVLKLIADVGTACANLQDRRLLSGRVHEGSRLASLEPRTTHPDGYRPYSLAVSAFHRNVDYAQMVKICGDTTREDRRRNSPSRYFTSEIHKLIGDPDEEHISTSYAERNNLNVRMMMRRMTRLTNAFSKKVENHAHQHAINFAYYNSCRVHKTLRCTPAMADGITASPWDVSDLVYIIDEES